MLRMPRLTRRHAKAAAVHVFAALCVGLATSARVVVDPLIGDMLPFSAFYPAVLVATVVGGYWSGLTACVLGGLSGVLLFIAPGSDFSLSTFAELGSLVFFTLMTGLVLTLAGRQPRRELFRRTLLVGTAARIAATVRFSQPANDTAGSASGG